MHFGIAPIIMFTFIFYMFSLFLCKDLAGIPSYTPALQLSAVSVTVGQKYLS